MKFYQIKYQIAERESERKIRALNGLQAHNRLKKILSEEFDVPIETIKLTTTGIIDNESLDTITFSRRKQLKQ